MTCKINKKWVDMELEHTKDRKIARKIVKDHLREFGCEYYPILLKLERKLKK